jgi:hypothetical protein
MNLFKGLMFLEGHFTRPEDIDDDFAPLGNHAANARWRARDPGAASEALGAASPADRPRLGLLQNLLLLGGRPMHAGHNLDVEEPFELPAAANDAEPSAACATCG